VVAIGEVAGSTALDATPATEAAITRPLTTTAMAQANTPCFGLGGYAHKSCQKPETVQKASSAPVRTPVFAGALVASAVSHTIPKLDHNAGRSWIPALPKPPRHDCVWDGDRACHCLFIPDLEVGTATSFLQWKVESCSF
jgi:hypothetical protein